MVDLTAMLQLLNETNGSDLHLVVGAQPCIRVDGELRRVQGPVLLPGDTSGVAHVIMPADRRERFESAHEADFTYSVPGIGRFRVNAYRQRGSVTLILRRVRLGSASFAELNLPPALRTLAELPRGLLLVTGPTGSGKTTTLAAMIDHINATKPVHFPRWRTPSRCCTAISGRTSPSARWASTPIPMSKRCVRPCARTPTSS